MEPPLIPPENTIHEGVNGGNTNRQIMFPFLVKNNESSISSIEVDVEEVFPYGDFMPRKKSSRSMTDIWNEKTKNSHGLLIYLMPAVLNQLSLLYTMASFLVDRSAQYLQPTMVVLACTLLRPQGVALIRSVLFGSALLGTIFMLKDTIRTGSYWAPLSSPEEGSYAIVTGYGLRILQNVDSIYILFPISSSSSLIMISYRNTR